MNNNERIQLNKMISENNVTDCTEEIRAKKHSKKIYDDVTCLLKLKTMYEKNLNISNKDKFDNMCIAQCNFLFNNYTDIFNKVKNNEINLDILLNLISVLKDIEEGKLDQHSGAFEVGKVLKEMYIDSALLKAERTDKKTGVKIAAESLVEGKHISWSDYKLWRTQVEAAIKSKDIPAQ